MKKREVEDKLTKEGKRKIEEAFERFAEKYKLTEEEEREVDAICQVNEELLGPSEEQGKKSRKYLHRAIPHKVKLLSKGDIKALYYIKERLVIKNEVNLMNKIIKFFEDKE